MSALQEGVLKGFRLIVRVSVGQGNILGFCLRRNFGFLFLLYYFFLICPKNLILRVEDLEAIFLLLDVNIIDKVIHVDEASII